MLSIFLLIPLSLMLFVVAIWAVRYAVKSNQFEDLDNASQRIILEDRQERRQTMQAHERPVSSVSPHDVLLDDDLYDDNANDSEHTNTVKDADTISHSDIDKNTKR
ncbi:cbb3-type cytochrome oxidase assembly protein CcoS [Psychrobacter sp. SWN149]|uniref:cbb3-type cytochrome oxidase assembly protein CcoS n=1 Tax=Psychrobacter sp. SWN149 TaxID=2792057 RepID=UPI0018CD5C45|nr:cbb3-type cytochrome oxidase assembly protein CcoS [Psychrobacter sp. SWN149]MBH0007551.1 cbb3-type cytochrome oxidase assembly protein CcoS [Psychrobacter sp. SWN149]